MSEADPEKLFNEIADKVRDLTIEKVFSHKEHEDNSECKVCIFKEELANKQYSRGLLMGVYLERRSPDMAQKMLEKIEEVKNG